MTAASHRQSSSSPSARLRRSHTEWLRRLDSCISLAGDAEKCGTTAPEISLWSVGDQLEHLLLADGAILDVIDRLCEVTEPTDQEAAKGRPALLGWVVLTTGFIPRGKAKAPDSTSPAGMSQAGLVSGFAEVRDRVDALASRLGAIQDVPYTHGHAKLGHFRPSNWVRFCGVHHAHHAKIVRDILEAS